MLRLILCKSNPIRATLSRYLSTAIQQTTPKSAGSNAVEGLAKDVMLYKNENSRFYRLLNVFALSQLSFWGVMAYNTMALKDVPVDPEAEKNPDAPFWKKINLGEDKWRNGLALSYAVVGYAILIGSWMYISRAVKYIVLRKDKSTVCLILYSPFGSRNVNVPLKEISAAGSRTDKRSYIPIKLEKKRFHYLLDTKDGVFPNPILFDQTVGVRRKFVTKK